MQYIHIFINIFAVATKQVPLSIFTIPKKDSNNEVLQFLQIGEHNLDACHFDEAYTAFEKASQLNDNSLGEKWSKIMSF